MSFEALGLTREVLTPGEPPVPRTVFADVSLRVAPGEALFIVGPSGAGKSLLLRALAGLDRLKAGTLRLGNQSPGQLGGLPAWRAEVAYIGQTRWALPGSPLDTFAEAKGYAAQRHRVHGDLRGAAASLALPPAALAQPWATLSGGQAARAALAVALALKPAVLLLDEPTGPLDAATAATVEAALRACGAALIWVSHDPEQPARVGGRVLQFPPSSTAAAPSPPVQALPV